MNEFLKHPWIRVLLIATTVAMCSWSLRETASITLPIISALSDVLVPVAIGFCIAYILTPVVDVLHRSWKLPRGIAAGVPFLIFLALLVVGTVLVVPTVIRQSSSLATRLFNGEPYVDVNHNGRWDENEPFTDSNGNGRYDAKGMFDAALDWVRERQDKLRSVAGLEVDDRALAHLSAAPATTLALRLDEISALMAAAKHGLPMDQWPAIGVERAEDIGEGAWSAAWPGATAAEVNEAAAKLPLDLRSEWRKRIAAKGRAAARQYVLTSAAMQAVRTGAAELKSETLRSACEQIDAPLPADVTRIDQELASTVQRMKASATVTADQIKEAKAFAQRCVEQEQAGEMAARLLLVELRGGGEPSSGARWLAPMIESLESSTKDLMEAVPRRLSSWAKDSMAGVDWVITFGLNLILIPIYAFFLILAMQNIRSGVREYLPAWRRDAVLRIIHDIERVVAAFFRGRLVVCLLCALVTYVGFIGIGFFGTGVPYAALFALLIGLATAIPLAGILFLIPAVLLNLLDGGSAGTATAMIVVYTVVQGLETFVFTPAIMGREVELHPVTLIVAILLCGKLIGVLGVILAVPIAATCRILAREFLWPRLKELAGRGTSARAPTIDTKL